MQLTILYAHTGDSLSVDSTNFTSVEDLKSWIAEQIKVPISNQILTTIKGTLVKQQTLFTEKELFLYSRAYIVPSTSTPPPTSPIPSLNKPVSFPDRVENQNDLSSWRNLFSNRVTWATSILSHANTLLASIDTTNRNISVIDRSLEAAATNLDQHVRAAGKNYEELKTWAFDVLRSQEKLLTGWEPAYERLSRIPIHKEVAEFVAEEQRQAAKDDTQRSVQPRITSTLLDVVTLQEVRQSGKDLAVVAGDFQRKVTELGNTLEIIRQQAGNLGGEIQKGWNKNEDPNADEASSLLEDIKAVVQKIQQDSSHIANFPNNSKSIAATSKIAHTHTKDYLPSLVDCVSELGRIVQEAVQRKNFAAQFSVQSLQAISKVEQKLYRDLTSAIKSCEADYEEQSTQSYQLLSLVVHLPSIYSSFLVECVRRREWNEKMGSDGSKLAEELAGLKEEEEKRRKKWYKATTQGGDLSVSFLPAESGNGTINIELNFQSDTGSWPAVQRPDLDVLLNALKQIEGADSVVRDLAQQMIDLDKPSRRQRKAMTPTLATRAFKMGSIHEAALANSSFLTNGDEATQIRRLRDDRSRLEERARMYESRVRKLEDLLHRQRSGNVTGVQFNSHNNSSTNVQSPLSAEPMSRNSSQGTVTAPSTLNRRISVTEGPDKALALRLVTLENDIAQEREVRVKLEAEAENRLETEKDWKDRITEADHTKRDLLANLEAQQQEFNTERKQLQDKLTDVEEQLESWKQRVDEVYGELDRLEESKALEAQKRHNLGQEMEDAHGELENYKSLLLDGEKKMDLMLQEHNQIRQKAEKETEELRIQLDKLTLLDQEKAESLSNWESKFLQQQETHDLAVIDYERQIHDLQAGADLQAVEQAKSMAKLEKANKEVNIFRSKISNVLVSPIASQQDSHHELANTQLMDVDFLMSKLDSFVNDLKQEVSAERDNKIFLEQQQKDLQKKFETRTLRAKDLTQKLYTHNARSGQLLEALGFSVIVRDGQSQIIRPSRSGGVDGNDMGKSVSMSTTLPPLPSNLNSIDEKSLKDVALLYWMEDEDSEIESEKYAGYLNSIGTFDLDAFSDAVSKRVKEAEHMARKWQKQCRDYRDKYHRSQAEASEKIAYKSFKEGDIALFLPTRNQVTRPWAAFNVGAPHYFLREQESHRLQNRDWLLARISKVEQRVVDLSKSSTNAASGSVANDRASVSSEGGTSIDEENPFQLSDGLRWYLLEAFEEGKLGAPSTPGLSSSTVAAANVDVKGSIRASKRPGTTGARKTLTKSLAQSGGPPLGSSSVLVGETSSVKSRESGNSGRKGSGNSASGVVKPVPPITSVAEGSAVVDSEAGK